jgi:hypothetical protein
MTTPRLPSEEDIMAEQEVEVAPKKRGRPRKGATTTKVKRKVEVEDEDAESPKRFLTEIERQAGGDEKKMRELLTKRFVPLIDVLPPLPQERRLQHRVDQAEPLLFLVILFTYSHFILGRVHLALLETR